jgi:tetratricopeptide (TPR) repeat protein
MEPSGLLPHLSQLPLESLPDGKALVARRTAIANALEGGLSPSDRLQVKADIVALFRDVDQAVQTYGLFKESVKALATAWKESDPSATAPRITTTQRVDHLGASTFVEKGWSLLSFGDAAGAEKALRRALELVPGSNEAETMLGWAQMLQENYDGALLTFHNVLMREPRYALARANVGYVCLRKKIYGEAIEHLSSAIRLDGDSKATLYAHLYLGQVYYEREMFDDAELFFRKALQLGPNLLQSWHELGRSLWYAGRPDDAMEAWRAGAAANKFNPWGKRCAEVLELVEGGGVPPR